MVRQRRRSITPPPVGAVESLADRVENLAWYHRMELPGGIVTPGVANTARNLPRLHLPESFDGLTVLDVGAWDGFYSFEAARRGAARVLATDSFAWDGSSWGSREPFRLARQALGLEGVVDDELIDVMDLSPEAVGGTFDVVLLLGVLYHLRDPITALERVATVCHGLLVIETETSLHRRRIPAARLYPEEELNRDGTNWWALNAAAINGLLKKFGFGSLQIPYRTPLVRRVGRATVEWRRGNGFRSTFRSQRMVVHARRI